MNFEDFIIKEWINIGISITNLDISLFIIFGLFTIILYLSRKINIFDNIIYKIWEMVDSLLLEDASIENNTFFFSIFVIIFLGNFIGTVPGLLPINGLIIVSMPITISTIIYSLFKNIQHNSWNFFKVFFSPKIPLLISIFIGFVEIMLLLSKVFIFSLRLSANITAGHIIVHIISEFVSQSPLYFKIIPFCFLIVMYILEILIGFLQAYIYLLLSINLFKNLIHIH
ncbi:hypothetical protein AB836_00155 [Rickettsiales bacterium (ex Bugula neritina AB1)]|nr:hypothetical protein AB836_00155 [Rickettsiales bacterium (ex Bugula neritina AB1)]